MPRYGSAYASVAAGRNQNADHQHYNQNFDDIDLGKMEFLQQSLIDMITDMLKTNSMFKAIQTGVKFANNIVMTLKFSNGY